MAEINQWNFTHQEVLELLIKKADVHEGTWAISFNLQMVAGTFPISPSSILPGAAILIQGLALQRIPADQPQPPGAATMDAAKVNPR